MQRCQEIRDTEAEIVEGNADIARLCLALSDWSAEVRILENEKRRRMEIRRRETGERGRIQAFTE